MSEYRLCDPQPRYEQLKEGHFICINGDMWKFWGRKPGSHDPAFIKERYDGSCIPALGIIGHLKIWERIPEEPPSPRHWIIHVPSDHEIWTTDGTLLPTGRYFLVTEEDWKERADTWNEGYEAGTGRP